MLTNYPAHLGLNTHRIATLLGSPHARVSQAAKVKALDGLAAQCRPEERGDLWTVLGTSYLSPYARAEVRALFDERYRVWRSDSLVDLALSQTPAARGWAASTSSFIRPTFMDFIEQNGVNDVRKLTLAARMLAVISIKELDHPQALNALEVLSRGPWADLTLTELTFLKVVVGSQQMPSAEGPRLDTLMTQILERTQMLSKVRSWPTPDLNGDNAELAQFRPHWGDNAQLRGEAGREDQLIECMTAQGVFFVTEAYRVPVWTGDGDVVAWRPVEADTVPWKGMEELGETAPALMVRAWESEGMIRPRASVLFERSLASGVPPQWLPTFYREALELRSAPEYRPLRLADALHRVAPKPPGRCAHGGFDSLDLMSKIISVGPTPNGVDIAGWVVGLTTYLDAQFYTRGWPWGPSSRERSAAIWLLVQALTMRTGPGHLGGWGDPGCIPAGKVMLSEWLDANFDAYKAATESGRSPGLSGLVM